MDINRVLMIDDEDDIRTIAKLSLESVGGMRVRTASGGEEGLRMAAEEVPDVILLDMMMPGKDGVETLQALRSQPGTRDVPVVFMTAKVQPQEVQRYLELGAVGVIGKPFDPMQLHTELRRITAPL